MNTPRSMKDKRIGCFFYLCVLAFSGSHVSGQITLTSTTGAEDFFLESTQIQIDSAGNASTAGDYLVTGGVSQSGVNVHTLALTLEAANLMTESGARLESGLLDRDSSGRLGITNINAGINTGEGITIGLDATNLELGYTWQVTGVRVEFVNGDESYTMVNRNVFEKSLTSSFNGMIDIRELSIMTVAGSFDTEVLAIFANKTVDPVSSFRVTGFELDVVKTSAGVNAPWRSVLYPEDWQPPTGRSFYHDKMLQDFSYAGYRRGEVAIPQPTGPIFDVITYGADPFGSADSTGAIQAAINAAEAAGGGVVSIPAGLFKVSTTSNTSVLRIDSSGVIVRGSGAGQTFILNTTIEMRNRSIFQIRSANPVEVTPVLISQDITTPTHRIHLDDTSSFAVGDLIHIVRDFTEEWITEHQMEDYWNDTILIPSASTYRRHVTAVNSAEGWIDVDIPMRYAILTRDNARVSKLTGYISECGIEDLSIGNVQHPGSEWEEEDYTIEGTSAYDVHASWLIKVEFCYNSWVSGVESFQPAGNTSTAHMLSNGVRLLRAKNITVRNCYFQRPQYGGGGGNGYMYRIQDANECLIVDSIAEFNRHGFVVSHSGTTGNVFLRCEDRLSNRATGSTGSYNTGGGDGSDNHMQFSHSNLWDQCSAVDSFYEAIFRTTTGHALSSAHGGYWNLRGAGTQYPGKLVTTEQGRYGYVIGTSGDVDSVIAFERASVDTAPDDHVEGEGLGKTLYPPSLYLDQLEKRVGSVIQMAFRPVSGAPSQVVSKVSIGATGSAQNLSPELFDLVGRTSTIAAAGAAFEITLDAVASISTVEASKGQKLSDGIIVTDVNGWIGVAGGTDGISPVATNREAIQIEVNTSNMSPLFEIKLETLTLAGLSAGESAEIISNGRMSYRVLAGLDSPSTVLEFDVSALGIKLSGGTSDVIATLMPSSISDFKLCGLGWSIASKDKLELTSIQAGNGISTLSLELGVSTTGFATTQATDFEISGATNFGASSSIAIELDAIALVATTGGIVSKGVDGIVSRDSQGRIGVDAGGIGQLEGIQINLDAVNVDPRMRLQLSELVVQFVDSDESFTVQNLVSGELLIVGGGQTSPDIQIGSGRVSADINALDLFVAGGTSGNVAIFYGNSDLGASNSFRLISVVLEVLPPDPLFETFLIQREADSAVLNWTDGDIPGQVNVFRTNALSNNFWQVVFSTEEADTYSEGIHPEQSQMFYRLEYSSP